MQFKAPKYKVLEPGVYDAMIENIEEKTAADGRGYALWTFVVIDEDGDEVIVRRPTSLNFGPKSIAQRFARAALNRDIAPGEVVDRSDLIGRTLRIVVDTAYDAHGVERNTVSDTPLPAR